MTAGVTWWCDHFDTGRGADFWARDRVECVASRGARTVELLRVVAQRDGWRVLPNGRHLCPDHAQHETDSVSPVEGLGALAAYDTDSLDTIAENAVAGALLRRWGFVPLTLRYQIARDAVAAARPDAA